MEKTLSTCDIPERDDFYIVTESDNCSSQYKSAEHFRDLQSIADLRNKNIIRVYGIAGHGKMEVAKISIQRLPSNGALLADAEEMVAFLEKKFQDNSEPEYIIEQIHEKELEMARAKYRCCEVQTIKVSFSFQVLAITPGKKSFFAAPRICNCDQCMISYGSCKLFSEYSLVVKVPNKVSLRSRVADEM